MTITLPDEMRDDLERRAKAGGFESVDEYVAWVVQLDEPPADITPQALGFASQEELEAKLLAALNSGPRIVADEAFWADLRKEVTERAARGERP
jgi:Arc/MetJ-type ribon-helix-helix transcriptional regulator